MKPPTIEELRRLAKNEDESADFARFKLSNSRLTPSEKRTQESMKRKARIYAHALRQWADRLEETIKTP